MTSLAGIARATTKRERATHLEATDEDVEHLCLTLLHIALDVHLRATHWHCGHRRQCRSRRLSVWSRLL